MTFSYLKKNFWLPTLVMIVPAIAACFLSTPYWEVSFVTGFSYNPYISIKQTFRLMFGDSWQYLWPVVVISILQIFGASLVMSAIDRHFRTGKLSLKGPWRLVNYSVFAIFVGVMVMCLISIVERFILFGIVILAQTIFSAVGASTGAAMAVISLIAVGMFVVHVLIITPLLYWAPVMFIYGYRFRDAAAASFKLTSGRKLFSGIFVPLLVCAGIQLLVGFLQAPIWAVRIANFALFLFTNVYVIVYVILSFYHISGLDRRDVVSYEFSIPSSVTATAAAKKPSEPERSDEKAATAPKKRAVSAETPDKSTKRTGGAEKTVPKKRARQTAKPQNKKPKDIGNDGGGDVV